MTRPPSRISQAWISSLCSAQSSPARLERRGLLRREVNPADRRRRQLHLTEQGQNVLATTELVISSLNEELLSRLSPAEQTQLRTLLSKLTSVSDDPAAAP